MKLALLLLLLPGCGHWISPLFDTRDYGWWERRKIEREIERERRNVMAENDKCRECGVPLTACAGGVACLERQVDRLRAEAGRLNNIVARQHNLLACYRTGKRPSGKVLDELAKLDAALTPPTVPTSKPTCPTCGGCICGGCGGCSCGAKEE